jgi:hypothetical protein
LLDDDARPQSCIEQRLWRLLKGAGHRVAIAQSVNAMGWGIMNNLGATNSLRDIAARCRKMAETTRRPASLLMRADALDAAAEASEKVHAELLGVR